MSPSSTSAKRAFSSIISPKSHICSSCRHQLSQQRPRPRYASTSTATATLESPPTSQLSDPSPSSSPVPSPTFVLKAGVVVSRPPLLTPDLHPFEKAYFLYQRRLNERLVLPFTQYFYYKRNTPAFEHFRAFRRKRVGAATRDIGGYNPYGKEGWNDEVLMGDRTGEPDEVLERLIEEEGRAEEFTGAGGDSAEGKGRRLAGLRRMTEADERGNQRSLERALTRTLYLMIRRKGTKEDGEGWVFPSGALGEKEGLKEAGIRVLVESCGANMNTWFVANHPIGHYNWGLPSSKEPRTIEQAEEDVERAKQLEASKTFFLKARILAGQADLASAQHGVDDFKWLTKDEIRGLVDREVDREYWQKVRNMLVEQ